jgi:hypothetical protein
MRFTKLSDNFIIVRQVENVKWKFVTVCRWHSAGKASGAVWRHVELAASKQKKRMPHEVNFRLQTPCYGQAHAILYTNRA